MAARDYRPLLQQFITALQHLGLHRELSAGTWNYSLPCCFYFIGDRNAVRQFSCIKIQLQPIHRRRNRGPQRSTRVTSGPVTNGAPIWGCGVHGFSRRIFDHALIALMLNFPFIITSFPATLTFYSVGIDVPYHEIFSIDRTSAAASDNGPRECPVSFR